MNWISWVMTAFGGLLTVLYGLLAYNFKQQTDRVKALEDKATDFVPSGKISSLYATQIQLASVELRMSQLVSRKEFLAYMTKMGDDRKSMHEENISHLDRVSADLRENRGIMQDVSARIDRLVDHRQNP